MAEDINYQIVPEEKFEIILMVQSVRILPKRMYEMVEKHLVIEHKYPKRHIAVEYPFRMEDGKKRADIVIFSEEETAEELQDQQNIVLIIECKKDSVKPTDKEAGVAS